MSLFLCVALTSERDQKQSGEVVAGDRKISRNLATYQISWLWQLQVALPLISLTSCS